MSGAAERIVTDIGLSLTGTGYEGLPIVEAVQQRAVAVVAVMALRV